VPPGSSLPPSPGLGVWVKPCLMDSHRLTRLFQLWAKVAQGEVNVQQCLWPYFSWERENFCPPSGQEGAAIISQPSSWSKNHSWSPAGSLSWAGDGAEGSMTSLAPRWHPSTCWWQGWLCGRGVRGPWEHPQLSQCFPGPSSVFWRPWLRPNFLCTDHMWYQVSRPDSSKGTLWVSSHDPLQHPNQPEGQSRKGHGWGGESWYLGCCFPLFLLGFVFSKEPRACRNLQARALSYPAWGWIPPPTPGHTPGGGDGCLQVHCAYGIPRARRGEAAGSRGGWHARVRTRAHGKDGCKGWGGVCRAGACARAARGLRGQRGGGWCRGREGSTAASQVARGPQGLWPWHVPVGKAAVGEEEEEQIPVKHRQVSKVPRVSSAVGRQTRRAAAPAPCALHRKRLAQFGDQVAKESWGRAGRDFWGCGKCSSASGDVEPTGSQVGKMTERDTWTDKEEGPVPGGGGMLSCCKTHHRGFLLIPSGSGLPI